MPPCSSLGGSVDAALHRALSSLKCLLACVGSADVFPSCRRAGLGRLHAETVGCFREAQLQGLLLGDEPGKPSGMSRPTADLRSGDLIALKLPLGHLRSHQ